MNRAWVSPSAAIIGAVSIALLGCMSLPPGHIHTGGTKAYVNDGYRPERKTSKQTGQPADDPDQEGRDFCRDVENRARKRAVQLQGTGWTLGILSALSVGAGAALTASTNTDNASASRSVVNASLPLGGAALGYIAYAVFAREKDASALASTAAAALNLADDKANVACNAALSDWNNVRPGADKSLIDVLIKQQAAEKSSPQQPEGKPGDLPKASPDKPSTTPTPDQAPVDNPPE